MFDFTSAEYSAIGCILIDARCLSMVREQLPSPEAFVSAPCRAAYAAACRLADEEKPVDPVTVGRAAGLENDFLVQCMQTAPSCTGAAQYAKTVAEGFRRRQLRELGDQLQTGALSLDTDADRLLVESRGKLDILAENPGRGAVKAPGESLRDFLQFRAEVNGGTRQAVKTGFPALDSILGGFAPGGLYILAARPGGGKSALGIALADMMARERTVLYVSLEMTEDELNARRVASVSQATCSYAKLMFGHTTQEEDTAIINACGVLNEHRLHISAVSSMTVAQMEIQARNAHAQVVMVDYLGLLSGTDSRAGEYDRITQISGDLKRMAKRRNCVIIALCQLNRESVSPVSSERPKLSHLRSSGAIEQDADGVLLLYRPECGEEAQKRQAWEPQQFFVNVAKNRHGRTGTAELAWYAPVNRFEDRSGKFPAYSWK